MSNRPYRTNVIFKLGPLVRIQMDIFTTKVSGASESVFRSVCPDCGAKPGQRTYPCPAGHGPFTDSQLAKGRALDKDTVIPLTDDELEAIRGSFPTRILDLRVCPFEDVHGKTLPGETAYKVRPNKKTPDTEGYHLLKAMVSDPSHVFYGKLKMDDGATPKPFMLTTWDNELLLQEIIPPIVLDKTEPVPGAVDPAHMDLAHQLVNQLSSPFDGNSLADDRIDRINEIIAAKKAGQPIEVKDEAPANAASNLLSVLQASLDASEKAS